MTKPHLIAALVASTIFTALPLQAQNADIGAVTDLAARKAAEGNLTQARQYLGLAMRRVWDQTPLEIARATLIAEEAGGYRAFEPLPKAEVKSGEVVRIYAEPVGYKFDKRGKEYAIGLSSDIKVKSAEGLVLAEANDFAQVEFVKRYRAFDIMMQLAFEMPDLKPGAYTIDVTIKDQHSDQTASHSLSVDVVE